MERQKNALKKINFNHTFSNYFAGLIDDLIEVCHFVAFVHNGKLVDFSRFIETHHIDSRVSIGGCSAHQECIRIVDSLFANAAKVKEREMFLVGNAFADVGFISRDQIEINTEIGLPESEPLISINAQDGIESLMFKMNSQPFVAILLSVDVDNSGFDVEAAVLDVHDGEVFLVIM